jgi:hypothetical protein
MKRTPPRLYVLPCSHPGCTNTALRYRVIPNAVCYDCAYGYHVSWRRKKEARGVV